MQVSPPATDFVHDLYAVVMYIHKECASDLFEAVGALDLTVTQIKLLHRLEEIGREVSLGEAAELAGVSLPAASRMVDEFVRRGLLSRHEDAADRRMKRVSLTADGQAMIRRFNSARLRGLEKFAASLSPRERAKLSQALAALMERPGVAACRLEGSAA